MLWGAIAIIFGLSVAAFFVLARSAPVLNEDGSFSARQVNTRLHKDSLTSI